MLKQESCGKYMDFKNLVQLDEDVTFCAASEVHKAFVTSDVYTALNYLQVFSIDVIETQKQQALAPLRYDMSKLWVNWFH